MSEIQSAEEFAKIVYQMCGPIGRNIEDGISWLSEMARARDKAIVERIKDRTIKQMHETGFNYSPIVAICDDVLRELGGEQ